MVRKSEIAHDVEQIGKYFDTLLDEGISSGRVDAARAFGDKDENCDAEIRIEGEFADLTPLLQHIRSNEEWTVAGVYHTAECHALIALDYTPNPAGAMFTSDL